MIRVDGEGFGGGVGFTHNHTCRFRTTLVSAVLSTVGGQAIFTCVSPAVTPAAPASGLSAPLELTLNGQNFSSDSVRFSFQPVPVVSRLSPLTGPSAGATRVLVHGAHLGGGFSTRCLFRNTSADEVDLPGTYLPEESAVLCISPPNAAPPLTMSLNAQQYFSTNLTFFEPPSLSQLSPSSGPVLGDTLINVTGARLPEGTDVVWCKIGEAIANGTRLSDGGLLCRSPALHATSERHAVAYDFEGSLPPESRTHGAASLSGGALSLGAHGTAGSLVLDAATPTLAAPAVPAFEATFHVWAPNPQAADVAPVLHPPAVTSLSREQLPGEGASNIWLLEELGQRIDAIPPNASFTSYSLSYADLHAPAPTGAGGHAFGGGGAGRGLRVTFALATAGLKSLTYGRGGNGATRASVRREDAAMRRARRPNRCHEGHLRSIRARARGSGARSEREWVGRGARHRRPLQTRRRGL